MDFLTSAALPKTFGPANRFEALIRISDVSNTVGLSASSIYRKIAEGRFPSGLKISARCTRWRLSDVQGWINAQGAQQ